jgi:RHS repeat-associated protein
LTGSWTTTRAYNVDGSTASTTIPAAGGLGAETITNTYDAHGYQLTAAGLDTYLSATTYQPWGDLYQRTLGSGANRVQATTDEWADTHRQKTITVGTEHPGTPGTFDEALTQQYNWTPDGTLASIDNRHAGATVDTQCFSNDYLQRLTTAFTTTPALGGCPVTPTTSTIGGTNPYWQTYQYDPTGNRTNLVAHGLGGAGDTTSTYTYPAATTPKAHTLTAVSTTGPGGTSNNSYTYGGIGQMTNMTIAGLSTDLTQNSQGSLATATIHATGGDQTTSYIYDADGNELLRTTPTSKTLYLGHTDINTNPAGTTLTGVTRYYTCDATTIASRTNPGTLSWIANDQQNTAQIAIDQTTLTVSTRQQDPFGNPRGTIPNWPNPRGFIGGTTEPDGLIHLGARMYDPTTARFTADDPITDSNDPQTLNGYTYTANNPLSKSDPTGQYGVGACSWAKSCQPTTYGPHHELHNFYQFLELIPLVDDIGATLEINLYQSEGNTQAADKLTDRLGSDITVDLGIFPVYFLRKGIHDIPADGPVGLRAPSPATGIHLLKPGPFAKNSIQAKGTGITAAERRWVNAEFAENGCHSCGSRIAGTRSGNAIGDHQPPTSTVRPGTSQRLFVHCKPCSDAQGLYLMNHPTVRYGYNRAE